MERLAGSGYRKAIQAALTWLPPKMRELLKDVHFFCGADPIYAGALLDPTPSRALQGRSYRDTACCGYPEHVADKRTTVFLPAEDSKAPWIVVHELMHVLDERLGFRWTPKGAVIDYAALDRYERFACWASEWLYGGLFLAGDTRQLGELVYADEQMCWVMGEASAGRVV